VSTFGLGFVIINDICQPAKGIRFVDGPAVHHATIKRGVKEYIVFRQQSSNKFYIEEVERNRVTLALKKIEDDEEWRDIAAFCKAAGLLDIGRETKYAN
tara:strand:+ start:810 stop:1106 length:297 start_codon:yes stop_codon:yes gene_type:complete